MQGLKDDVVARRALRARLCPTCRFRPAGSETLPPSVARACEPTCAIFVNLESLMRIADKPDWSRDFERAITEQICQHCKLVESAGDYCADRFARTCPLSCYAPSVLEALEALAARHARAAEPHPKRPGSATSEAVAPRDATPSAAHGSGQKG